VLAIEAVEEIDPGALTGEDATRAGFDASGTPGWYLQHLSAPRREAVAHV
jgi:hypothetical protein